MPIKKAQGMFKGCVHCAWVEVSIRIAINLQLSIIKRVLKTIKLQFLSALKKTVGLQFILTSFIQ